MSAAGRARHREAQPRWCLLLSSVLSPSGHRRLTRALTPAIPTAPPPWRAAASRLSGRAATGQTRARSRSRHRHAPPRSPTTRRRCEEKKKKDRERHSVCREGLLHTTTHTHRDTSIHMIVWVSTCAHRPASSRLTWSECKRGCWKKKKNKWDPADGIKVF